MSVTNYAIKPINNCRECVSEFYKLLFSKQKITIAELNNIYNVDISTEAGNNSSVRELFSQDKIWIEKMNFESYTMKELLKDTVVLCQGFDEQTILKLIQKAPIFNDGLELDDILELVFPNGNTLFYEINMDPPIKINLIWTPDGTVLNSGSKMKFRRPGIINDKDSFTNIRKEADANSKVVGKFIANELFFFTPVSGSNWWPVYRSEVSPCIGYIYKSKITFYRDFPESIKKKVTKIRTGC